MMCEVMPEETSCIIAVRMSEAVQETCRKWSDIVSAKMSGVVSDKMSDARGYVRSLVRKDVRRYVSKIAR